MKKLAGVFGLLILTASYAEASVTILTCKNPRRFYTIAFDDVARTVIVKAEEGSTNYPVTEVKKNSAGLLVVGEIPNGPSYKLGLGEKKELRLFLNNKLFQTDPCH